jgi:hypothetical protein
MATNEPVTKYYPCNDNGHSPSGSITGTTPPKFFEPEALAYVQALAQNMMTPDTKTYNTSEILYGGGYYQSCSGPTCISGCGPNTTSRPFRSKGTVGPF